METIQQRQIAVERDAIQAELAGLVYPLYFFDFETIDYAVPTFPGCKPYQQARIVQKIDLGGWRVNKRSGMLASDQIITQRAQKRPLNRVEKSATFQSVAEIQGEKQVSRQRKQAHEEESRADKGRHCLWS